MPDDALSPKLIPSPAEEKAIRTTLAYLRRRRALLAEVRRRVLGADPDAVAEAFAALTRAYEAGKAVTG